MTGNDKVVELLNTTTYYNLERSRNYWSYLLAYKEVMVNGYFDKLSRPIKRDVIAVLEYALERPTPTNLRSMAGALTYAMWLIDGTEYTIDKSDIKFSVDVSIALNDICNKNIGIENLMYIFYMEK